MKLIFLDVDGVLNTPEVLREQNTHLAIGQKQLAEFVRIVKSTGAKVVLSSSWRLFGDCSTLIHRRLKEHNINILSDTKDFPSGQRAEEIQDFLSNNLCCSDISQFAIIDDFDDAEITGHFFLVNQETGLTKELADSVIEFLNK